MESQEYLRQIEQRQANAEAAILPTTEELEIMQAPLDRHTRRCIYTSLRAFELMIRAEALIARAVPLLRAAGVRVSPRRMLAMNVSRIRFSPSQG